MSQPDVRTYFRVEAPKPPVTMKPRVVTVPSAIKVFERVGRLYVAGPGAGIARKVPGSYFNKQQGWVEISLTLESLRKLRELTGNPPQQFATYCTPEVLAWAKQAAASERRVNDLHKKLAEGWRMDFPWYDNSGEGLPPFAHQVVMGTAGAVLDGVAYLGEMGTGKTRAAAETVQYKLTDPEGLDVVVVVCPKGVMPTWEKQIQRWTRGLDVHRLYGAVADRRSLIRTITSSLLGKPVLVLNYDVLHLLKDDLSRLCEEIRVGFLPDEMHRLKNPHAERTKGAMQVAQYALWREGLTGTPILNGAHDIRSQWYVVDLGNTFGANYVQFKREFFDENPYAMRIDPQGDEALDEIGQRIRRRGLRYLKKDCLDLPPKMYEKLEVEMTEDQQAAYDEMEEELIATLEEWEAAGESGERVATAANQLVLILRLTQITSGFVKDSEGKFFRFTPNPKLDAVEEMVDEQIGSQQIIIWTRYTEDIEQLLLRLAKYNPVRIDGSQQGEKGQLEREAAERRFQSGEARLLIANPGAGGVGLNLYAASLAIVLFAGILAGTPTPVRGPMPSSRF